MLKIYPLIAVIIFLALCQAATMAQATLTPQNTVIPATAANTAQPTRLPVTPTPSLFAPGTYVVGLDITPGIYRGDVEGEMPGAICYWARYRDLSGNLDGVLASNNVHGQFYVEIRRTDYAFKTTCELTALDSIPARSGAFPTTIKYGMYLVGRDILPGTYQGRAINGAKVPCIWERRSNVAGEYDGFIANRHEAAEFTVRVEKSDFSFSTTCDMQRIGD